MNPINKSHQSKNATWTALVSLSGLEILKRHAPNAKLESKIQPGSSMLIVLRPLATNISWVCSEVNSLRSISKEVALSGLDRAIEMGLVEIIGFNTGDDEANDHVSRRVKEICGFSINP